MTGNVAQVLLTDEEWASELRSVSQRLKSGGRLVFEVRDPAREAWRSWTRELSFRRYNVSEVGGVETWVDLLDVSPPLVSFRRTFAFDVDGAHLTSDSTLRLWSQSEICESLDRAGLAIEEIRDAPDRPDQEFVFVATQMQ